MSLSIQRILDLLINTLDRLIKTLDIALNAFYKLLDYLIKTFEEVSKKILNLLTNILRLLFYILPFILMIIIGPAKNWQWMTLTGWSILILVIILFFRDFMAEIRGVENEEQEEKSPYSQRAFFVVLVLNIILVTYSVSYYLVGISPEKYIINIFSGTPSSSQADIIREKSFLNIISSEDSFEHSQFIEAINYLGKLKSQKAKPLLISRINSYNSKLDESEIEKLNSLISSLEKIGGPDACSTLVNFEINCKNLELKKKAQNTANKICGQ